MKDKLLEIIEKHSSIVIFGHANPDGDCYGSQAGLKRVLQIKYPRKRVYMVGTGFPAFFSRLGEMDKISDEIIKSSLGIIVDCSNEARCEDQRVSNTIERIKFDHHLEGNNPFTGVALLNTGKIAAAEIIVEWAFKNRLKLDKIAAEAFFLGISTDSGRFMYDLTTPLTFKTVSRLLEYGVVMSELYNILYQNEESDLAIKGFILSHYKKTKFGLIYIVITQADIKKLGIDSNRAAGQVNLLSNIIGYPIWASFTELPDGRYRAELRSKGVMIQPIALKFGGGGHPNACGISSFDGNKIEDVIIEINNLLRTKNEIQ